MASVACQMTTLRVIQSHRAAVDSQGIRGCRASAPCASFGVKCGAASTWGVKLHTTGVDSWGCRNSSAAKFVASAIAEEIVTANQADNAAPAEGLSMYFKAEGSLNENNISKVTKALEETEGVSQVKVYVIEGAATVELVKQTDIQATGVASSLVELIENAGFKMQALSLGFDGDEAEDDDNIDYADEEATVE